MTDRIKKGDLLPAWRATLDNAGTPVDLTTATAIRVIARREGATLNLFDRTVTLPGSSVGVVTMPWQTADTSAVCRILTEVEVMWPGSKPQTFPAVGWLVTDVYDDFG